MNNQQILSPKASLISAITLAAALAFVAAPALAGPGHGDDETDHQACTNHDEMSAEDHEKGHDEGAQDCQADQEVTDDGHGDHQH
jgi:hypothetical protein